MNRNLWFCTREVKETAYKSLVRPILEYGSCAWATFKKKHIKKIKSVQRKAARFCMQDHRQRSSVTKMLTELDWETLEERRMKDRMIMTYKIRNDLVGIDAERHFHTTRTENIYVETRNRSKGNLVQMYPVRDVYKYSFIIFIPRASREWNQLTTHQSLQGFFPGGDWGGPPIRQKFCQSPPIWHLSPFLDQGLSPPAEVRPRKFEKLKYIFVSNLTTFKLKSTLNSCISCLK